ncbi:hypothetical protein ACIGO9_31380 [Nocardia asteroides]
MRATPGNNGEAGGNSNPGEPTKDPLALYGANPRHGQAVTVWRPADQQ